MKVQIIIEYLSTKCLIPRITDSLLLCAVNILFIVHSCQILREKTLVIDRDQVLAGW